MLGNKAKPGNKDAIGLGKTMLGNKAGQGKRLVGTFRIDWFMPPPVRTVKSNNGVL